MRYMLYECNGPYVTLDKEIDYLKSFILLNKLRYSDSEIKVDFFNCAQHAGKKIAPMLLLPFVENAFKYGISMNRECFIKMAIHASDEFILFTCENTNFYRSATGEGRVTGIGLANVKRRLELLYPNAYRLNISNSTEKFQISLQLFQK